MNDSPASTLDVDLDGVAGEVFEKAGVVALVCRGVVERRIRKGENGRDLPRRSGELENEYNRQQEHCDFPEGLSGSLCETNAFPFGSCACQAGTLLPPRRIWPPILHPRSTARSDPALEDGP